MLLEDGVNSIDDDVVVLLILVGVIVFGGPMVQVMLGRGNPLAIHENIAKSPGTSIRVSGSGFLVIDARSNR